VSLNVWGIGIMKVMQQFLVEAVLLSVVGGLIGVVFGVGGAIGMSQLAGWTTLVTPGAVGMSFGFAAAVGVFFGYYPARKASQLDPITALRYE
jgi:ABC-type antimicrobial peptide transport system permease subunit